MTKYFTQWDDDTIGSAIAGFTTRTHAGGGTPTFIPAYGSTTVLPHKKRYLVHTTGSAGTAHVPSWNVIDGDANRANFSVVIGFAKDLCTTERVVIYARGQGTASVTEAYLLQMYLGTNTLNIDKIVASVQTVGIGVASFTFSAGTAYYARFEGNGTALKVRLWDAALGAEGEPTTWNISITDASVTAAGWIGVSGLHGTVANRIAAINFLAVGTNGDSAAAPRTNAEYNTWLDKQSVIRCVLAEMSAVSYVSTPSPFTGTKTFYSSNIGYTSAQQDSPSLTFYDPVIDKIPTFSREMSIALSGKANVGFGAISVSNPVENGPPTAPALEFKQTHTAGAAYTYWRILAPSYVIPAGSSLRYDFFIDPANPAVVAGGGGIEVDLTAAPGNGRSAGWVDTLGVACQSLTSTYAAGIWYSRTLPFVASMIGATISSVNLVNESDTAGAFRSLYRNLRVVDDNSGATLLTIWASGQPTANVVAYSNLSTTQQVLVVEDSLSPTSTAATTTLRTKGVRDDWLRMKWKKDYVKLYLGDATWPKHDFRLVLLGRLDGPVSDGHKAMSFQISDLLDKLDRPFQTTTITGGSNNANKSSPVLIGRLVDGFIDPISIDTVALQYRIHDGTLFSFSDSHYMNVYDNYVLLEDNATKTIGAVNAATDTLTASAAHGMVAGYTIGFTGAPPAPLGALPTIYYVIAAGLTAADFRVSTTHGGAAVDITGATTGASIRSWGWRDNADGTITLAANPAGRILVSRAKQKDIRTDNGNAVTNIDWAIFTKYALSKNFKDQAVFTAFDAELNWSSLSGIWLGTESVGALEILHKLCGGFSGWYGFTPDGLLQIGRLGLPASTAVMSFTTDEVKHGSLRLKARKLPLDFRECKIKYNPSYPALGEFQTSNSSFARDIILTYITYGAASAPIDTPIQGDTEPAREFSLMTYFQSFAEQEQTRLKALYAKQLGVYEFQTRLGATRLSIGETISLTHERAGWKQWGASDPASPDNTGTIDSRLAVVIGIDTDLSSNSPFPVKLTVFRQIPQYAVQTA